MDIKIAIAYHKKSPLLSHPNYLPIHVGKALHPEIELGIQPDNTGDNISDENGYYCELTAIYWLWKNSNADIKGLYHYRRILNLTEPVKDKFIRKLKFFKSRLTGKGNFPHKYVSEEDFITCSSNSAGKIDSIMSSYDIIATVPCYCKPNLKRHFCEIGDEYLNILEKVIELKEKEYLPTFMESMRQEKLHFGNMTVMKSPLFSRYCEFLFGCLAEVKDILIRENYLINLKSEKIFSRKLGYLAEILTNVFINYQKNTNGAKIKELPVLFLK